MPPAQQPSDQPAEQAHASGSWSPPVDSHVHTEWSWDAPREADMVRSCEQAVAAGLPGVAFTDHLDFTTWTDGDRIGAMDLDPHRMQPDSGFEHSPAKLGDQLLDPIGERSCSAPDGGALDRQFDARIFDHEADAAELPDDLRPPSQETEVQAARGP